MSTPDVNSFLNFLLMSMGSSSRILNHFQSILWLAPGLQKLVVDVICFQEESLCQVSPGYWGATDRSRNQFKSIEVTLCIQARSRVLKIIEWHNLTIMRATFHHPIQSCASVCNVVKVTLIITRCYLSISLSLPFLPFCLPFFLP